MYRAHCAFGAVAVKVFLVEGLSDADAALKLKVRRIPFHAAKSFIPEPRTDYCAFQILGHAPLLQFIR